MYKFFYFINRKDEDEEGENAEQTRCYAAETSEEPEDAETKKRLMGRLLGIIPAIISIIAFFITEDMTLPMQMVDKWTLLMVIILIAEVIVAILSRKKKSDDSDEDNYEPAYK